MLWGSRRPSELVGSVLFRGEIPPRPEKLPLERFRPQRLDDSANAHWRLKLELPTGGTADVVCIRQPPRLPASLVDHDPRLSPGERQEARAGRSTVSVMLPVDGTNPLGERKRLLRLLHALMAGGGVVAVDHLAQALWSRASLDEECAHDADVDILSLFTVHALAAEGQREHATWLHTHGLEELGFQDFDVVQPACEIDGNLWDVVRAVAYVVVDGTLRPGARPVDIVGRAPAVRLVPTAEFRAANKGRFAEWESQLDDEHVAGHGVLCDAVGGWSLFRKRPSPWSFLGRPLPEDVLIRFTDAASGHMAERALAMLPLMRSIRTELTGLPSSCLVKLRYGEPGGIEHLWFEVHDVGDEWVDATLLNEPFGELKMHRGERGRHPLERLSDWQFMTVVGSITPRGLTPLRTLREHRGEIEAALREGGT